MVHGSVIYLKVDETVHLRRSHHICTKVIKILGLSQHSICQEDLFPS